MCRSEPQTPVASTRTTASSAASRSGSGRSSTRTSPGAWKVTACMGAQEATGVAPALALTRLLGEHEAHLIALDPGVQLLVAEEVGGLGVEEHVHAVLVDDLVVLG